MNVGYSDGPSRSTALPGGNMTPHDLHPLVSSNVALLAAAAVRIARKNVGRYAARCSGFREERR